MTRLLKRLLPVLLALCCVATLFVYIVVTYRGERETYSCVWSDGTQTEGDYSQFLNDCVGLSDTHILLERETLTGKILLSERAKFVVNILRTGALAQLLQLSDGNLYRLEKVAIYQEFGKTVFFEQGAFAWTGSKVTRENLSYAQRVVLLSGRLTANYLQTSQATLLELRAEAQLSSADLLGSKITSVQAEEPYFFRDGGVYENTLSGVRLRAVVPTVSEFTVDSACEYLDRGAFYACENLTELRLPFVGNTKDFQSNSYVSELGYLFTLNEGVPLSIPPLKRLTVTGGILSSNAFVGNHGIETLVLCGMAEENISTDALHTLAPNTVHTPYAFPALYLGYTRETLACGCYFFTKIPF